MVRKTWHSCQPVDLHRLARRYFMHAQRIELQKLARELGISRATAYRWAGSADQLVGEVLVEKAHGFRQLTWLDQNESSRQLMKVRINLTRRYSLRYESSNRVNQHLNRNRS